jgi:hypothetical protein
MWGSGNTVISVRFYKIIFRVIVELPAKEAKRPLQQKTFAGVEVGVLLEQKTISTVHDQVF